MHSNALRLKHLKTKESARRGELAGSIWPQYLPQNSSLAIYVILDSLRALPINDLADLVDSLIWRISAESVERMRDTPGRRQEAN